MTRADAVVVGAGPAGSTAALLLARAGVRVRLLDRASFPRDKLCGDTLNPGTLALLDRLGVGAAVRQRAFPMRGMTVTGPGGAEVSADYPSGLTGAVLARRDLDLLLVEAAIDAGAMFDDGVAVRAPLCTDDGKVRGVRLESRDGLDDVHGGLVIAADGRRSRLASAAGLTCHPRRPKRWAFGAYFTGVTGLCARGEMHVHEDGYTGLAPLSADVVNVCVVRGAERTRAPGVAADEVIAAAVGGQPRLAERFASARQISKVVSLGPLASHARTAGMPGLLLAGDAAGFIDPMTGDGLRFAVRGGELAAEAALRELSSGKPAFERLALDRRHEFGGKWRLNRTLRWLTASPSRLRVAAALAVRWSTPFESLIRIAGDCSICEAATETP